MSMEASRANLDVAIEHLESKGHTRMDVMYTEEALHILQFLRICEEKKLELLGIGFHVYRTSIKIQDMPAAWFYEKGFIARKIEDDGTK